MVFRNESYVDSNSNDPLHIEKNFGVLISILGFLTVFGVPVNGMVVYIFSRMYKREARVFNLIMISHSLSDLLLIAVAGPTRIIAYVRGVSTLSKTECKLYGVWVHITSVSSLTHLMLLAMERYRIIRQRKMPETGAFFKQAMVPLVAWLYAAFWAILPILGWSEYAPESQHVGCAPKWGSKAILDVSYNITIMFFEFFFPLAVILFLYFKIFGLIKSAKEEDASSDPMYLKVERSISKLTTFMVAAFVFSWLPYTFCSIWTMVTSTSLMSKSVGAVPSIFAKSSVMWNPILYGLKHKNFRSELKRVYRRARGRGIGSVNAETRNEMDTNS